MKMKRQVLVVKDDKTGNKFKVTGKSYPVPEEKDKVKKPKYKVAV